MKNEVTSKISGALEAGRVSGPKELCFSCSMMFDSPVFFDRRFGNLRMFFLSSKDLKG